MDRYPDACSCSCAIRGPTSCCPGLIMSEPSMNLSINSTTGMSFELSLPHEETVEGLRRKIAQRLQVPKERLTLLHKDTRLTSGKLQDFGVSNGSKLTLVPSVEAGLMFQSSRPENNIMHALESLSETQVSGFLCGRSPLALALYVGDHMMVVQLQLALQSPRAPPQSPTHPPRAPPGHTYPQQSPTHPPQGPSHPPRALPGTPRGPSGMRGTATAGFLQTGSANRRPSAGCSHSALSSCCPHHTTSAPPSPTTQNCNTPRSPPSTAQGRKPGAVIESFVSHAPGVFSGTFSGTLHPSCQDDRGQPRRNVRTILQIISDLLSAALQLQGTPMPHQATPPAPHSPAPTASSPSPSPSPPASPLSHTPRQQRPHAKAAGVERERHHENRATRCKVERLQQLLQQRRLRRKFRRNARGPYTWSPGNHHGSMAARNHSNSSIASTSPSSSPPPSSSSSPPLDLEYEDDVWLAEVLPTDIGSEVIIA
ncbi:hypothetical protein ACEWY4_005991 [Coilia grayii]|uniref:Ubiquitin-like domain-containing protein n=1 Tax=Coilia grayii TaxID=363190 RepID=A0ABD1KCK1_9TELE